MALRGVSNFATAFVSFLLMSAIAAASNQSYLSRGSSINMDHTTTILVSPNGAFSCGFYKVARNAFTFSIWFSRSAAKTVAWSANGKGSRIKFQKDGGLELLDYNGSIVWSTNTTSTRANGAMLLDSGNLVVMDPDGHHLWTSFASTRSCQGNQ